jgi:hypothetical protein
MEMKSRRQIVVLPKGSKESILIATTFEEEDTRTVRDILWLYPFYDEPLPSKEPPSIWKQPFSIWRHAFGMAVRDYCQMWDAFSMSKGFLVEADPEI